MKIKIAPSILSADFSAMGEAVKKLEASGADLIHCDVMDGSFVQPISFGGQMVKNIRPLTKLELDAHLMVEHPLSQIKFFADAGADIITVHVEACKKISDNYLLETLETIKSYNVKCGAAVNPDVDVEELFGVVPVLDMALVMSVFPGYGGQKFISSVLPKIKKLREYALSIGKNLDIQVDGGITEENSSQVINAGANVLVAGSTVFKSENFAATIEALRK